MSSIKPKEKPCKGTTPKTKDFGCGKPTYHRVYGLGKMCGCYSDWLLNSEAGQLKFKNSIIKGKKIVETENKKKSVKEKKERKIALLSPDKYRADILQPKINEIARAIDYGQPCIAMGVFGKMNGGHFIAVGSNRTIALNLHNIHIQSFTSNHWKGGDNLNYRQGVNKIYGKDYLDFMESLQQTPPIKLTVPQMQEVYKKAIEILKTIELVQRTPQQRIELRNKVNEYLSIYESRFSCYL